ncbi:MAG: hypothetical protein RJB66_2743 [Pseudomonadota bacterium]
MEQIKPLLLIITELARSRGDVKSLLNDTTELLLRKIHQEVLTIVLKLLGGIILTAAVIYSLFSIGDQITFILMTEENGTIISILFFLLMMVVCSYLLFLLFRVPTANNDALPAVPSPPTRDPLADAIERLTLAFIEGLLEGIEKHKRTTPQTSEPCVSTINPEESGEMP